MGRNRKAKGKPRQEDNTPTSAPRRRPSQIGYRRLLAVLCVLILVGVVAQYSLARYTQSAKMQAAKVQEEIERLSYLPRQDLETSGFLAVFGSIQPWEKDASQAQQAQAYDEAIARGLASVERHLARGFQPLALLQRAAYYHAQGDPARAYQVLVDLESRIRGTHHAKEWLYTVIFYQGATAFRLGENENCILCRGESSCIFPIAPAAIHTNPAGSRQAIKHFADYLERFPEDLEVKWLLNLAHMTLGEHPDKVDPRYRLPLEVCAKSEFDIGKFRDVGHLVGVNRLNQSGGAIMDDFDNDGLLDFVVTSWAPSEPMAFYRNLGTGKVAQETGKMGLEQQLGGLYCVQTDYNNDGYLDIFIPRGSWLPSKLAQLPSLLRNDQGQSFTDVSRETGLNTATNSTSATWADYDNDGDVDLFLCCQRQPCLLYRNDGAGHFEEVLAQTGLSADLTGCLGAAWIDVDNDRYPELFVNISTGVAGNSGTGAARIFRNNGNGTFADATRELGIDGPMSGFSCWAFDYDNDGWLDIFATTTSHTLGEVVQGLLNQPCQQKQHAKLFRNLQGKRFQDVTDAAGLNKVYSPMGSNFGDLDNDGYLDFYLGTGDPALTTLVPNRLFKNVAGQRFAEITGSSRTGHLQKGHGVACGDWDRNGTADLFIELGGAIQGDRYHNVLFQNPGQGNNWLSVKLVGVKTNRAAIGARIKVVTAEEKPLTIHRHVSSGSSFGANPLEQHIGLGQAQRIARLEIDWPTSGETQVFENIPVNQGLVITESAAKFEQRQWKPIPLPQ